jgi:hypothetical protein
MKKSILILFVIMWSIILTGCAVQDQKPRIMVTHVLAVTETGDTLRLPINMIRPNVYYKIVRYPNNYYNNWNQYPGYYQPYYNNNRPIYSPSNNNNNSNNNNSNNNTKPVSKPATPAQNKAIRIKKGGN